MLTLVSFPLCPFVQRARITMNFKGIAYDIEYIDLEHPPAWFEEISPLGKVPLLKVQDEVLFESAVINEYVDEISGESLHPKDPLKKAKERAYIELASAVLGAYYQTAVATEEESYLESRVELERDLTFLMNAFEGPYFRGDQFGLVDSSVVPAIQRLLLTRGLFADLKLSVDVRNKVNRWAKATLSMEAVKNSVSPSFEQDYDEYMTKAKSFIHLRES